MYLADRVAENPRTSRLFQGIEQMPESLVGRRVNGQNGGKFGTSGRSAYIRSLAVKVSRDVDCIKISEEFPQNGRIG